MGGEAGYRQDREGHTKWGTLGHWSTVNCTYRVHGQTTRQTDRGNTQWGALGQSIVHSEGTDNQSDRGNIVWSTLSNPDDCAAT